MIKLGSNSIGKIYLGSNSIGKAYLGSDLVFQKGGASTPIVPIFTLSSPTTTQNYDTGVALFDTPKSFTILCNATFDNYNWNTDRTEGVFGISTGKYFRFGAIANGEDHMNDSTSTTGNRYGAMIMNDTDSGSKCISILNRVNGSQTRRIAVRYNHNTRKIEASSDFTEDIRYYTVPGDVSSQDTLKLLIGGASGTVTTFDVYDVELTNGVINNFISG